MEVTTTTMTTTTDWSWTPTTEEVRRIVAQLRPVIDECECRSRQTMADAVAAGPDRFN